MGKISTDIHHSSRAAGKYHQRGMRNGEVQKAKSLASRDISRECGENKMFSRNYIIVEYAILENTKIDFDFQEIE